MRYEVCLTAAFAALSFLAFASPEGARRTDLLHLSQIHRGGGADARPDNTLEACLWAWGNGAAPEIDARLTKDGVAIAMHDGTLKRVGRGISAELANTPVKDLEWAQIRDVDVGSYMRPEYASYRLATVESVLSAMVGRPDRILYLDEKGASPELVAKMAQAKGVDGQVYYASPSYWNVKKWKDACPKGKGMVWMGFKWPKAPFSKEAVREAEESIRKQLATIEKHDWYVDQVQFHLLTDMAGEEKFCPSAEFLRREIAKLHEHGVTVQAFNWRQGNDKETMKKVFDLGFDSIATDYPLMLFELIRELKAEDSATKHNMGN